LRPALWRSQASPTSVQFQRQMSARAAALRHVSGHDTAIRIDRMDGAAVLSLQNIVLEFAYKEIVSGFCMLFSLKRKLRKSRATN
jgi:hypothetical protein